MKSSGTFISDLKEEILKSDKGLEALVDSCIKADAVYREAVINFADALSCLVAAQISQDNIEKHRFDDLVRHAVCKYKVIMLTAI